MGSARNAVLGDTYANLLAAAGYEVQREYYVNDAGTQMRIFAETLYRRYRQALGQDAPLEKPALPGRVHGRPGPGDRGASTASASCPCRRKRPSQP